MLLSFHQLLSQLVVLFAKGKIISSLAQVTLTFLSQFSTEINAGKVENSLLFFFFFPLRSKLTVSDNRQATVITFLSPIRPHRLLKNDGTGFGVPRLLWEINELKKLLFTYDYE